MATKTSTTPEVDSNSASLSAADVMNEAGSSRVRSNVRQLLINRSVAGKFISNKITTAKYNWLSFLPKFLFEQFRRYANIFFLFIGLLQQIPNVSPTGRFVTIVPFSVILALTALKELIEDIKRRNADSKVNNTLIPVLTYNGEWEERCWQDIMVGDVVCVEDNTFFPADLILLASSEPQGMCYIETSNLDGETNLKIRSALPVTCDLDSADKMCDLRAEVECEHPNQRLYEFKGNLILQHGQNVPLSPSTVLLRGAKLMNTSWVFGVVVYTGHETKLLMNSTQAPLKRSNIDRITNYQIICLLLILIVISLFSAGANELQKRDSDNHDYLGKLASSNFFYNFLTFVILYNNLIPISLQVTLEFVKFTQAYFINWDQEMFYEPTQTPAIARTSNLNEELGQIKYVFSDKTGTLTRNIMEFKKSSIAGEMYMVSQGGKSEAESRLISDLKSGHNEHINDFLTLMAICHTVIPEEKDNGLFYNASSPDEKALVEGAALYGYKFLARKPESVLITTPSSPTSPLEYQILNVIEFTSMRKRMTVVVRTPSGNVRLFTKGADTTILERLGSCRDQRKHQADTVAHLEMFAQEGLRTLCLAIRDIPEAEYQSWDRIFHAANTNVENKQEEINKAAELIEQDLTLIGATAIEDKLQEGVPQTIAQLLEANIHVWVLTGDKQETAINIGHSCRLLREGMSIIILNADSLDEAHRQIDEQLTNFRLADTVGSDNFVAVVVDGQTLTFALHHNLRQDFLDLCCSCQSVICCRVSPIQKAEMVELVQKNTGAISLAIGDGANDVAMIQKADVGVGISGNEGMQAANSSDFAVAQFRFLARLLFVHGAWNYTRISKVILYSFYKNICLYIIELWFAIYNFWSGQVLFERWTIGLYNIIFTSFPPIAMGLFDQYCRAESRMRYPSLYHSTQKSEYFNCWVFWHWMGNSLIHSVLLFWLPMLGYRTCVVWVNGHSGDYLVLGNIVYSLVVVTVCLKAGLEMESWSWICHLSVWGSIALWFIFLIVYSFFWPLGIPLAANMAGMAVMVYSTPLFWWGMVLIVATALMPDIIYKAVKVTAFTTETDKIRIAEIMKRDVGPYISGKQKNLRLTEASSLLRNVKKVFNRNASNSPKGKKQEMQLNHGYAFSQEESGAVSQVEFIRRYDTTKNKSARAGRSLQHVFDKFSKAKQPARTVGEEDSKQSRYGGHSSHQPVGDDDSKSRETTTMALVETDNEQDAPDPPPAEELTIKNSSSSSASRERVKYAELPRPQLPSQVPVVKRPRPAKSDAENGQEAVQVDRDVWRNGSCR